MQEITSGHYEHEGYTIVGDPLRGFWGFRPDAMPQYDDAVETTRSFSEIKALIRQDQERCATGDFDISKGGTIRREQDRLDRIDNGEQDERDLID